MTEVQVERVDRAADALDISRSELIRRAVGEWFENHPETDHPPMQEALIA